MKIKGVWNQYTSTIAKDNFEEDDKYEIFISSVDKVGNVSQSSDEYRSYDMSFYVDKTNSIIQSLNLSSGDIFNTTAKEVVMSVTDNIGINDIQVLLNGQTVDYIQKDDPITFTINESHLLQEVQVKVIDHAEKETTTIKESFEEDLPKIYSRCKRFNFR